MKYTLSSFPPLVGAGRRVATILGREVPYLDADSAATTQPFALVAQRVQEFLARYGSVHRGSGANSRYATQLFTAAQEKIFRLVGGDPRRLAMCITSNTTTAINKLRRKLDLQPERGDRLFFSEFEHTSNDLPWRAAQPVRIPTLDDGTLDLESLDRQLAAAPAGGRKLVAVTGASNLTGALTALGDVARVAHRRGAWIAVDAAQLVAHRAINMEGSGEGDHLDFLAFSGHKMYAPYGAGVLLGDRSVLGARPPDDFGGGTVDFVTHSSFDLTADLFRRENPGTPNAVGLAAMALAGVVLTDVVGFEAIVEHERELLDAARRRWPSIPRLRVLGEMDYSAARKCAILSIVMEGVDHGLLAARLAHEFGIGVRHGHLCQFANLSRLLDLSAAEVDRVRRAVLAGDRNAMYGVVRASFSLGNRVEDTDRLADALEEIAGTLDRNGWYAQAASGAWQPCQSKDGTGSVTAEVDEFFQI